MCVGGDRKGDEGGDGIVKEKSGRGEETREERRLENRVEQKR